jgi:hypothetical protein
VEWLLNPAIPLDWAKVITDLSRNVTSRGIMGHRARAMLKANFARQHAFQNWARVLAG